MLVVQGDSSDVYRQLVRRPASIMVCEWEYFRDGRAPRFHTHRLRRPPKPYPLAPLPMVRRAQWKAAYRIVREDNEIVPLAHPVHTVRFTYTDSWICENRQECCRLVSMLQENHICKHTYDIMWNFLISAEGEIYEGRGWDEDAMRPEKYDHLKGNCLDIAYIGGYSVRPLTIPMKKTSRELVRWGVDTGKILCCHETIPHTDPQVEDIVNEGLRDMYEIDETIDLTDYSNEPVQSPKTKMETK